MSFDSTVESIEIVLLERSGLDTLDNDRIPMVSTAQAADLAMAMMVPGA